MKIRAAIILLTALLNVSARAEDRASLAFAELHADTQETVSMNHWKGAPMLVSFWRSDCAPCLQEMKLLPGIARDNPHLTIALISLENAVQARAHLPTLPENVHLLVAQDDGKRVLAAFGNDRTLALPYSVMLDSRGDVCGKQYGILSPERVKTWQATC